MQRYQKELDEKLKKFDEKGKETYHEQFKIRLITKFF